MHVIFGATGRVGDAAARALRGRGCAVRAVMRDLHRGADLEEAGCELTAARLEDPASIVHALAGAESALVMCPMDPGTADVTTEANAIVEALGAALATARPPRIVAVSDYGAQHEEGTGIAGIFHRLEQRLASLDGAHSFPTRPKGASSTLTFLRSAEHMENAVGLLAMAGGRGIWPSFHAPLERRYPLVAKRDVGAIAAELLVRPGPRVVHVEGPERLSPRDVAAQVATHLGRAVEPVALAEPQWEGTLRAGGTSAEYARLVAEMLRAHRAGRIEVEEGLELRLGSTGWAELLAGLRSERGPRGATPSTPSEGS